MSAEPTIATLARTHRLEQISTSFLADYPGGPFAKIIRGTADETTMTISWDVLAASDAGDLLHGATLLEPTGDTRMCARLRGPDGGPAELIILEYGPDAGSRQRPTGATIESCRELRRLDGGLLAYTLDEWANDAWEVVEYSNPKMRPRFVRLDANARVVDGGVSVLDAGFCVTDARDPLAGWCDALTHDEVLRFDSWFGPPTPRSVFRHDGGVTVIGDVEGHLLVGINEHHTGDGYARFDVGWLRDGRFELIRERQVVPLGYGMWTANTAALTFIRPDLQGWDVVEAPLQCP